MSHSYSAIVIIYNPKSSSGRAKIKAERLCRQLKKRGYSKVETKSTEYSGHAEVIAHEVASKYKQPLIISVSGDGGYNEVINGALKAVAEGVARRPVCAIQAAGNANDHRRSIRKQRLLTAIIRQEPRPIDVLKLTSGPITRYAHSYIGIGLSAHAAAALNQEKLNRWREIMVVMRALLNFKPFSISHDKQIQKLDSLIFANIRKMSKYIKLNEASSPSDGIFDVITHPHDNRLKFFINVFRTALFGLKSPPQYSQYTFTLLNTTQVHLDAEPLTLKSHSRVTIEAVSDVLYTVS